MSAGCAAQKAPAGHLPQTRRQSSQVQPSSFRRAQGRRALFHRVAISASSRPRSRSAISLRAGKGADVDLLSSRLKRHERDPMPICRGPREGVFPGVLSRRLHEPSQQLHLPAVDGEWSGGEAVQRGHASASRRKFWSTAILSAAVREFLLHHSHRLAELQVKRASDQGYRAIRPKSSLLTSSLR